MAKIHVMVVPETEKFRLDVSHESVVYINAQLGIPRLKERNVKYIAPFWLNDDGHRGVNRIYEIIDSDFSDSTTHSIILGNSFVLEKRWDGIGQVRKFEYHPLDAFGFIEIRNGLLLRAPFNE